MGFLNGQLKLLTFLWPGARVYLHRTVHSKGCVVSGQSSEACESRTYLSVELYLFNLEHLDLIKTFPDNLRKR